MLGTNLKPFGVWVNRKTIMEKNEFKKYLNNQIMIVERKMGEHIMGVSPQPNPLYMVEPNQREMIWSDDDYKVYDSLDSLKEFLQNQLNNLNNNIQNYE